ncbi:D-alanine--D-alanine ligase [Myroides sp. WP-1]|uniref:D-alanine--D-alanine ligase family protein n=1 Tax=Myroides sp. WP-1 TaxID=2759944 RepID=UPI00351C7745
MILGNHENNEFYVSISILLKKIGLKTQMLVLDVNNLFFSKLLELKPLIVLFTPSDFSKIQNVYNEFGIIQGFLECHNIKYSGSGSIASILGSSKYLSKVLFRSLGLKTPKCIFVRKNQVPPKYYKVVEELGKNIIIKPNSLGDSVGVSIIRDEFDYLLCIDVLKQKYNGDFLLEELIDNNKIEYTTGIFERKNEVIQLPICKTTTFTDFFSYESKKIGLNKKEFISHDDEDIHKEMQRIAYLLHKEFNCKNFSRTDFLVDKERNIYVLEINLLPGLQPNSIFPQLCEKEKISYDEILFSLVEV